MGPSLALARGLSPVQRDAVGCKTSPQEEPATSPAPEVFSFVKEKAMTLHSSTLAWKIPWMEEPGGL